jgi:hypothetical protein
MRLMRLSWYHLLDSLKEFWALESDYVGFCCWFVVGLLVCAGLWMVYGFLPR